MNKFKCVLLSGLIAATWCSQSSADYGNTSVTVKEIKMGSCHFRVHLLVGDDFEVFPQSGGPGAGRYRPSSTSGSFEVEDGFKIICLDVTSPDSVDKWVGTKQIDGRWLRYDSMGSYRRPLMPFSRDQHARILKLKAINATGFGLTIDDITGAEDQRGRNFSGCVVRGNQALCLGVYTMFFVNRKSNLLPQVQSIFQRIQFIDAKPNSGAAR
jgi:hypothetical protein